jgi:hypothetical protein
MAQKGRHHSRGTAFFSSVPIADDSQPLIVPLPAPSSFPGRLSSSGIAPKLRTKSNIPSRPRNAAHSPLCTCSTRPRQRGPAADHSFQKRTTKVLNGGTGYDSAMPGSSRLDSSSFGKPEESLPLATKHPTSTSTRNGKYLGNYSPTIFKSIEQHIVCGKMRCPFVHIEFRNGCITGNIYQFKAVSRFRIP